MNRISKQLLMLIVVGFNFTNANAQRFWEEVIQISGITMTADSLMAIPDVTIVVKNQNRGVHSGYNGVFSLVCAKGDTLEFSSMGYQTKEYIIPDTLQGQYFSLIQLMVQDTYYLAETIIRPNLPSTPEEFEYAFKYWDIPDDPYMTAQRNTSPAIMNMMIQNMPKSGGEQQSYYQNQQAQRAYYYGQQHPMGVMNPLKWNEFFNAWKRGDFRRKR